MFKIVFLISTFVFIVFLIITVINLSRSKKSEDTVVMPFASFEKIYKLAPERWSLQRYYTERLVQDTSDNLHKNLFGCYRCKWVHVTFNFSDFWKYRKFCFYEKIRERKKDKLKRDFQNNLAYKLILDTAKEEIEAMRKEANKNYESACDILGRIDKNE